ncbi:hypothetical protein ES708_30102 [subsurface metagenome]
MFPGHVQCFTVIYQKIAIVPELWISFLVIIQTGIISSHLIKDIGIPPLFVRGIKFVKMPDRKIHQYDEKDGNNFDIVPFISACPTWRIVSIAYFVEKNCWFLEFCYNHQEEHEIHLDR